MMPTPRGALVAAITALSGLVLPRWLAVACFGAVLLVIAVDLWFVRRAPVTERHHAHVISRGVASPYSITASGPYGTNIVRQAASPDLLIEPQQATGQLEGTITGRRRGRHTLVETATRTVGALGLGAAHHRPGETSELLVYPDMPAAYRLVHAVRTGAFAEDGRRPRGPLGLGTEFESVREYAPDDDIRQVNWQATARLGRPMSNQFRVEQDRDVIIAIDAGRLMAGPVDDSRTRLDAAIDAATAVALVADEVGDRAGVVAFDGEILRYLRPGRAQGEKVVRTIFDLEPSEIETDYETGFRAIASSKRAFVLVLTDIIEETAARSLLTAAPVLLRRHSVAVASVTDEHLDAMISDPPTTVPDVFRATAALDVLQDRAIVAERLRRAGAAVIEAQPSVFSAQCVAAYIRAKAQARL